MTRKFVESIKVEVYIILNFDKSAF